MSKRTANFYGLTPEQLEVEANKLLFGSTAEPRRRGGEQYMLPKKSLGAVCADCGKPRSCSSGQRCKACYRKTIKKYEHHGLDGDLCERLLDVGFEGSIEDGTAHAVQITRPDDGTQDESST